MSNKGLDVIRNLTNTDIFNTRKNTTIHLEKADAKYLNNLSDLLSVFVKKNFKITLNKDNFENLLLNVYSGFLKNKPTTHNGGSKSRSEGIIKMKPRSVVLNQSATARRVAEEKRKNSQERKESMKMVPYEGNMEMARYGTTGMTKKSSKKSSKNSGYINQMCNMNSYDIKVVGIFVVACILIYLGYSSLDETTRNVMGKDIISLTKEILVNNNIFEIPKTVIILITDRISEKSVELFNTAASEISTNVAATCSTNAGMLNTLFNTGTYTACIGAQTATEFSRITAEQTYYMTTTLTQALSGVSSGLNLLYIGLGLFGSSTSYIAVRLGVKNFKSQKYLTNGSSSMIKGRIQEVDGGNNTRKSKKSRKSKSTRKTRKSKSTRKTRKY